jgi:guanylate kinase
MKETNKFIFGTTSSGKTTSIDDIVKSKRVTTRKKRDDEIDSKYFDGSKTTHGYFISKNDFIEKEKDNNLILVHKFPDPINGESYAYSKKEIELALNNSEKIIEQIDNPNLLFEVKKFFGNKIKTVLNYGLWNDFIFNLYYRDGMKLDIFERIKKMKKNIIKYTDYINYFDDVQLNFSSISELKPDIFNKNMKKEIYFKTVINNEINRKRFSFSKKKVLNTLMVFSEFKFSLIQSLQKPLPTNYANLNFRFYQDVSEVIEPFIDEYVTKNFSPNEKEYVDFFNCTGILYDSLNPTLDLLENAPVINSRTNLIWHKLKLLSKKYKNLYPSVLFHENKNKNFNVYKFDNKLALPFLPLIMFENYYNLGEYSKAYFILSEYPYTESSFCHKKKSKKDNKYAKNYHKRNHSERIENIENIYREDTENMKTYLDDYLNLDGDTIYTKILNSTYDLFYKKDLKKIFRHVNHCIMHTMEDALNMKK